MGGTWLDTKANKIVTDRPEEGVQLISPDVEPTSDETDGVTIASRALGEVAIVTPPPKVTPQAPAPEVAPEGPAPSE